MKNILVGLLLFVMNYIYSQQTITGTVVSELDNSPIPYINVAVRNSKVGTVTDNDGNYSVKVISSNSILVFSSIGYQTREVKTLGKNRINITLSEVTTGLSEVVITALNKRRASKELGYAVQSIQQKDIAEVKAVNFLDNLTGKLARVSIASGSATGVGSSSKIVIRGEKSFTNNNPLFIVDGTPINNNTVFDFTNEAAAGFQEVDFGNGAMEVNSDDIESVSVLKGASAAALYGTRASNGVIIINTKKAKDKFSVSLNSSLFVDTAFQLPQFQNLYGQGTQVISSLLMA